MRRRCGFGCLLAMAACCATPAASPCAPSSPMRQPARPERDSATDPPSAAPAIAWGRERDGLQTRLTLRTTQPAVGKPLLVRLELRNTSRTVKRYDAQQAAVNHSLVIKGPEGGPVRYIAGDFQTAGNARTIKPGETVTLVAQLDVTRQYLLAQPGRYAIRFRGQRVAFGASPIPASNTLAISLGGGRLSPLQSILVRMLRVTPKGWRISLSGTAILFQHNRTALKRDVTTVQVWFSKKRLPAGATLGAGKDKRVVQHLGEHPLGYAYLTAPPEVRELWPQAKQKIQAQVNPGEENGPRTPQPP